MTPISILLFLGVVPQADAGVAQAGRPALREELGAALTGALEARDAVVAHGLAYSFSLERTDSHAVAGQLGGEHVNAVSAVVKRWEQSGSYRHEHIWDSRRFEWIAYERGRGATSLAGDPVAEFELLYRSQALPLVPELMMVVPAEFGLRSKGGAYTQLLDHTILLEPITRVSFKGKDLLRLLLGRAKKSEQGNSNVVWELLLDDSDSLLNIRTRRFADFPGSLLTSHGVPSVEVGERTFALTREWIVESYSPVNGVCVPTAGTLTGYTRPLDSKLLTVLSVKWNALTDEIQVGALTPDSGRFHVPPVFGARVLDGDAGHYVLGRSAGVPVVGIHPRQVQQYQTILWNSTHNEALARSIPEITIEEAIEALGHGLPVNCAGVAAGFYDWVVTERDRFEDVANSVPISEDGATSIGDLAEALSGFGHDLQAIELSESDLRRLKGTHIAHVPGDDVGHFVLLQEYAGEYYVVDPPMVPALLDWDRQFLGAPRIAILTSAASAESAVGSGLVLRILLGLASVAVLIAATFTWRRSRSATIAVLLLPLSAASCNAGDNQEESGALAISGTLLDSVEGSWGVDLGEVQRGTTVSFDFAVRNSGDRRFELSRLGTSCSCTDAEMVPSTLEPGEEAVVSFDVRIDRPLIASNIDIFGTTLDGHEKFEARVSVQGSGIPEHLTVSPFEVFLGGGSETEYVRVEYLSLTHDAPLARDLSVVVPNWISWDISSLDADRQAGDVFVRPYVLALNGRPPEESRDEGPWTGEVVEPVSGKSVRFRISRAESDRTPESIYVGRLQNSGRNSVSIPLPSKWREASLVSVQCEWLEVSCEVSGDTLLVSATTHRDAPPGPFVEAADLLSESGVILDSVAVSGMVLTASH